jgi:YrbI family 3-deoxy-D-manno-octulosonate 8-phosphate phosphatase
MKLHECTNRLKNIEIIFFDFDGVFTDNHVYVTTEAVEIVKCWRGDGIGLQKIKKLNIPIYVISTENNKVVASRAQKLGIPCYQNVSEKLEIVKKLLIKHKVSEKKAMFVGNDENDCSAVNYVGFPAIPNDASPQLLKNQKLIQCESDGGKGVVREICEAIYQSKVNNNGEFL